MWQKLLALNSGNSLGNELYQNTQTLYLVKHNFDQASIMQVAAKLEERTRCKKIIWPLKRGEVQ